MANGCVCIDEETLTHYIHDSCIQFWALYSSNIVPNINDLYFLYETFACDMFKGLQN